MEPGKGKEDEEQGLKIDTENCRIQMNHWQENMLGKVYKESIGETRCDFVGSDGAAGGVHGSERNSPE